MIEVEIAPVHYKTMKEERYEARYLLQTPKPDQPVIPAVAAGFPSPADDFLENRLDLNQLLVRHPAATFFVRVSGDSMIGAGIHSGDLLIVDRSLDANHKRVVIAVVDGQMTVKRISREGKIVRLLAENPEYHPIIIEEGTGLEIWGVVTHVIHNL